MRPEYANLALILAFVGMPWHFQGQFFPPQTVPMPTNSESAFALDKRIKLSAVDLYDLELIPRLSEVVALRILEQRDEIIMTAVDLPQEAKYMALAEVRGIGEITAKKVGNYLVLE